MDDKFQQPENLDDLFPPVSIDFDSLIKVYLDSAILSRIINNSYDPKLVEFFFYNHNFIRVYSAAHYTDTLSASQPIDFHRSQFIKNDPFRIWALPGGLIPRLETEKFIETFYTTGSPPDSPPRVLFRSLQKIKSLLRTLGIGSQIIDCMGTRQPYDSMRQKAHSYYQQCAKVMQTSNHQFPGIANNSEANLRWILKFLNSQVTDLSPEDEKHWAKLRLQEIQNTHLSIKSADQNSINRSLLAQFPWLPVYIAENWTKARIELYQAFYNDDRVKLKVLIPKSIESNKALLSYPNPLGYSPSSQNYYDFTFFASQIPRERSKVLLKDLKQLEVFFKYWLRAADSCPGSVVCRDTSWYIMSDSRYHVKPSIFVDLLHIPILPYVDVFFADKHIIDNIMKSNRIPQSLKDIAKKNSEFEPWLRHAMNSGFD